MSFKRHCTTHCIVMDDVKFEDPERTPMKVPHHEMSPFASHHAVRPNSPFLAWLLRLCVIENNNIIQASSNQQPATSRSIVHSNLRCQSLSLSLSLRQKTLHGRPFVSAAATPTQTTPSTNPCHGGGCEDCRHTPIVGSLARAAAIVGIGSRSDCK